jgi:hypothetical protein
MSDVLQPINQKPLKDFIMDYDINLFREGRKLLPPAKYEQVCSVAGNSSLEGAQAVLVEGWRCSKYPPILLRDVVPWEESLSVSRSWCFHIHCWDMLDSLLSAYSLSGDSSFFDPCLIVAFDWIARYPTLEVDFPFAWYDMAVGLRVQRLTYIIDIASRLEYLEDSKIGHLLSSLELHRIYLSNDRNISFTSNHGFFQVAGQLAMASSFPELPGMDSAKVQANERFKRMLSQQFTEEGIHREHSPDYHRMVYRSLRSILRAGLAGDEEAVQFANKIDESLAWFIQPNGFLVNFGDSDYHLMRRGVKSASHWSSPAMQFMTSGGEIGSPPDSRIGAFPASGFFVARDRWPSSKTEFERGSYLAQTLCFHSRSHKHCDDLSFVWYDRSHEILVDSGRYGYLQKTVPGSELHKQGFWYADPNRMYVESTRAHNTIEIDGKDSSRKGAKPYGSALLRYGETKSNLIFTEAHVCHFKTIHHERVLVLHPGHWILVFDHVHEELDVDHEVRQWFHFAPSLVPHTEDQQLVMQVGQSPQPLRVASLLPATRLSEIYCGEKEPRYQGWWSPKERTMIPNPAVSFKHQRSTTATFATLFAFCQRIVPSFQQSTIDAAVGALTIMNTILSIPNNPLVSRY